jgi:hypothetical protein
LLKVQNFCRGTKAYRPFRVFRLDGAGVLDTFCGGRAISVHSRLFNLGVLVIGSWKHDQDTLSLIHPVLVSVFWAAHFVDLSHIQDVLLRKSPTRREEQHQNNERLHVNRSLVVAFKVPTLQTGGPIIHEPARKVVQRLLAASAMESV